MLPAVRSLYIAPGGGSLPVLYANAKGVAYLHGTADEQARAVKEYIQDVGPTGVKIEGHYGNTAFYIDRVSVDEP